MKRHTQIPQHTQPRTYLSLYGAALGTSLALGQGSSPIFQTLLCIGAFVAAGLLAWLVDRRIQQRRIAPTVFIAAAGVSTMIVAAALSGVPARALLVLAGAGGLVGGALGLVVNPESRLSTLLIVLSTLPVHGLAIWQLGSTPPTGLERLGATTLGIVIVALLLALGMPYKHWLQAASSSVLLSSLMSIWSAPVVRCIQEPTVLAISFLTLAEVAGASIILLILIHLINSKRILETAWWHQKVTRDRVSLLIHQALQRFEPELLQRIEGLLGQGEVAWLSDVLCSAISPSATESLSQIIQHPETQMGRYALRIVTDKVSRADTQSKPALLEILRNGAASPTREVWAPCLDELIQHNVPATLQICKKHLEAGNVQPMAEFLHRVSLDEFKKGVQVIEDSYSHIDESTRHNIVETLSQWPSQEVEQSSLCLAALLRLQVILRPKLQRPASPHELAKWQIVSGRYPANMRDYWKVLVFSPRDSGKAILLWMHDLALERPEKNLSPSLQNAAQTGRMVIRQALADIVYGEDASLAREAAHILSEYKDVTEIARLLTEAVVPEKIENLGVFYESPKSSSWSLGTRALFNIVKEDPSLEKQAVDILSTAFRKVPQNSALQEAILEALTQLGEGRYVTQEVNWFFSSHLFEEVITSLSFLIHHASSAVTAALPQRINEESLPAVCSHLTNSDDNIRGILSQALSLCPPSIKRSLAQLLTGRYGSLPDYIAQQAAAGEIDLRDWLYPFQMRPAEATEDVFHLEDMVNEPDDLITASHITTWFHYHLDQRPDVVRAVPQQAMGRSAINPIANPMPTAVRDVVIAGHANAAICKEVSSKVLNAVLEIDEANIARVLVVTGAGLIRVTNDVRKLPSRAGNRRPRLRKKRPDAGATQLTPPLLTLQGDLSTLVRVTGLVKVNSVRDQSGMAASYDNAVGAIRTRIQQAMRSNHSCPVLLHPAGKTVATGGVVLPFYQLREPGLAPLQFTVPRSLLGPQFKDLIEAHSRELREGMIEDARRRLAIYEEWKEMDIHQLRALLDKMMGIATGGNAAALTEAYFDVLMNDEPINFPVVLSRQLTEAKAFANLDIVQQRTQRLIEFLRNSGIRGLTPSALQAIQEPKYPIVGTRNYDDPYVQSTDGVIAYVSLQDLVEWHLPDMIGLDEDWIERMDDFLRKFDPQDPDYEGERLDAINIAVFLDSFLRGWPPVFLQEEDAQKRYKQWARQQRAVVWHDVHARLRERQISMLPLRSDSVLFDVEDRGEAFVVTPHYLTDTQTLATYLGPEMGIPYYINHWQHRERIVAVPGANKHNREMAQEVYRQATQGLPGGQFEAALEGFKQALRIHPTWTAEPECVKHFGTTLTGN